MTRRLVIGISGASGIVYGIRMLEHLQATQIETHLIMTRSARLTLAQETSFGFTDLAKLADHVYSQGELGAAISSGSFQTDGMVIAPCSVKSMSEIASGVTSTLLSRAADVMLKERRRLVLLVRETPLHTNHLRTMVRLSEIGAIVAPPVPAFYTNPDSIEEIIDHTVGRAMDLFDIDLETTNRWTGMRAPGKSWGDAERD